MIWNVRRYLGLALAALYAASIAFAVNAHAASPVAAAPSGVDLSAFALPDGSLPVLCLGGGSAEKQAPAHLGKRFGCDACRIMAAPLLIAVGATFEPVSIEIGRLTFEEPVPPPESTQPADIRSRAPPALA